MKQIFLVLAVGLLILPVGRAYADAGKKDVEKLQGTWQYASMNVGGNQWSDDELKKWTVSYAGDRWVVRQEGKVFVQGTQKLDPNAMPHQIDSRITAGEGQGTTMLGIYRWKDGMFEVCFDPSGKERPKSFEPKEGQFAGVIKREKK